MRAELRRSARTLGGFALNTRTFLFLAVVAIPNATLGLAGCAEETSSPWCDGAGVVLGKIGPDGKCVRRDASADSDEGPDAALVIPEAGLDADAKWADSAPSDARDHE